MTPKSYANALRKVADFYDSVSDDFPTPDGALTKSYYFTSEGNKELVRKIALELQECEKDYTGAYFTLTKDFNGLCLAFTFTREAVCEKKVIGFKECEGYTIRPYKEEIVEWECKSILSQEEADVLQTAATTTIEEKLGDDIPF